MEEVRLPFPKVDIILSEWMGAKDSEELYEGLRFFRCYVVDLGAARPPSWPELPP